VNAVQVNRVGNIELVTIIDHDALALTNDERGARNDAVVRLRHDGQPGAQRPRRGATDDVKDLRHAAHLGDCREGPIRTRDQARLPRKWRCRRDRAADRLYPGRRASSLLQALVGIRKCGNGPEAASKQNDRYDRDLL